MHEDRVHLEIIDSGSRIGVLFWMRYTVNLYVNDRFENLNWRGTRRGAKRAGRKMYQQYLRKKQIERVDI